MPQRTSLAWLTLLATLLTARVEGQTGAPPVPVRWWEGLAANESPDKLGWVVLHVEYGAAGQRFLKPAGLVAHLTSTTAPTKSFEYPAGVFIHPPEGLYSVWLEGNSRMSPTPTILPRVDDSPPTERRMALVRTIEAGTVSIRRDSVTRQGWSLLRLGRSHEGPHTRDELLRRTTSEEIRSGVLMPIGKAIGFRWNEKLKRVVGLSHPIDIKSGADHQFVEFADKRLAALAVRIDRGDDPAEDVSDYNESFLLRQGKSILPPDAIALSRNRAYAFWLSIEPGPAELEIEWRGKFLDRNLELGEGELIDVHGQFQTRPSLEVELNLPKALQESELRLTLRSSRGGPPVTQLTLPPGTTRRLISALRPDIYAIDLATPFGDFTEQVQMEAGQDQKVVLTPEVTRVFGTVTKGEVGHAAEVTFTTSRMTKSQVRTEIDGSYEIALLNPLVMASVKLLDSSQEPWLEFFSSPISETTELNFELPAAEHRLVVLDKRSGRGIPNAAITFKNRYRASPKGTSSLDGNRPSESQLPEKSAAQSFKTDDSGISHLPPLRAGVIQVGARAQGYRPAGKLSEWTVEEDDETREFRIELEPIGDTAQVHLQLPSGSPAFGAELLLVESLQTGRVLYSETSDPEGVIDLPIAQPGIALIRHPDAAYFARQWSLPKNDAAVVWELASPAPQPLHIRFETEPDSMAPTLNDLAIQFGGFRISGGLLHWLVRTPVASNGVWSIQNLPMSNVVVEVTGSSGPIGSEDRHHQPMTTITWPWPPTTFVDLVP